MTRNLYEPTDKTDISRNRYKIKDTRQKPLTSRWITPSDPSPVAGAPDWTPALQNGWTQVAAPLEKFSFRLHYDGSLEFKGHLNSSGAASATVAVTLPGAITGDPNYLLSNDQFFLAVIYDGATPQSAMVYIDSTTGEVTITFPV